MIDLYTGAKFGPMNVGAFNGNAGTWARFSLDLPTNVARALFMLMPQRNVRLLQGGSGVLGTNTTAALLQAYAYYPMVVENAQDKYISIRSDDATGDDLEITLISDVMSWTLTAA